MKHKNNVYVVFLFICLFVLAVAASVIYILFPNQRWTSNVGVLIGLWSSAIGLVAILINRKLVADSHRRIDTMRSFYELQLDKEVLARAEYEQSLQAEIHESINERYHDDILLLRNELALLKQNLENLTGSALQESINALIAASKRLELTSYQDMETRKSLQTFVEETVTTHVRWSKDEHVDSRPHRSLVSEVNREMSRGEPEDHKLQLESMKNARSSTQPNPPVQPVAPVQVASTRINRSPDRHDGLPHELDPRTVAAPPPNPRTSVHEVSITVAPAPRSGESVPILHADPIGHTTEGGIIIPTGMDMRTNHIAHAATSPTPPAATRQQPSSLTDPKPALIIPTQSEESELPHTHLKTTHNNSPAPAPASTSRSHAHDTERTAPNTPASPAHPVSSTSASAAPHSAQQPWEPNRRAASPSISHEPHPGANKPRFSPDVHAPAASHVSSHSRAIPDAQDFPTIDIPGTIDIPEDSHSGEGTAHSDKHITARSRNFPVSPPVGTIFDADSDQSIPTRSAPISPKPADASKPEQHKTPLVTAHHAQTDIPAPTSTRLKFEASSPIIAQDERPTGARAIPLTDKGLSEENSSTDDWRISRTDHGSTSKHNNRDDASTSATTETPTTGSSWRERRDNREKKVDTGRHSTGTSRHGVNQDENASEGAYLPISRDRNDRRERTKTPINLSGDLLSPLHTPSLPARAGQSGVQSGGQSKNQPPISQGTHRERVHNTPEVEVEREEGKSFSTYQPTPEEISHRENHGRRSTGRSIEDILSQRGNYRPPATGRRHREE